ncbi:MAG TPA: hypothetical protein VFW98_11630 [Gemmatimonadaceae bacterium]|nr:hypothetical protein [Gemmatimonadaceae bacterium]
MADAAAADIAAWDRAADRYAEIVDRGAAVLSEPADQAYGVREFAIRDLNGVGIVFGQDIEPDR